MYKTKGLPNTRIDVADALRGIAVAGIIIYHAVEHFNIFTSQPISNTLPIDQQVADTLAWLLSGKMYGIFAMLFGLSFFIMNDNQQQKHQSFEWRFSWRMSLLLCFGIVNVAFYDGDILIIYALIGLLLIPISHLSSRWVWTIIIFLSLQPIELMCLLSGYEIDPTHLWEMFGTMGEVHQYGSFWHNTLINLKLGFPTDVFFFVYTGRLTQILCLFILGMQLGRHRLFYNEGQHLYYWYQVLIVSVGITVLMSLTPFGSLDKWLSPIYNLVILSSIVSAIVTLWYAFPRFQCVMHHLCLFGRMSLTNYLLQSIIGTIIFCGYGFGYYHKVGTTYAALIGIVMVIVQYLFCRYWFRHHSRGPLEELWKRLTWL